MDVFYHFADASCKATSFLGFPRWYAFLQVYKLNGLCTPVVSKLSDIWLIIAAVIEILLRVSSLVAVGFVIYGGVKYMMSQGNPDATSQARTTIIDAMAGLFIAVSAAVVVQFIAGRIN